MIRAGQRGGATGADGLRAAVSLLTLAGALAGAMLVGPAGVEAQHPIERLALARTPAPVDSAITREVRTMMERSAAAWNRGDLDAFVSDYAPGQGTTYIGRRGIVRGPAEIRAVYAPRFAPGAKRGTLRFEALEVDRLGPDVVNAIAYYVLTERTAAGADSTIARGPTSLVMRKLGGAWKIVHDHSS